MTICETEQRLAVADADVNAVPEGLRFFAVARKRAEAMAPKLDHLRRHPCEAPAGFLWGLPVLVKDLTMVQGDLFNALSRQTSCIFLRRGTINNRSQKRVNDIC